MRRTEPRKSPTPATVPSRVRLFKRLEALSYPVLRRSRFAFAPARLTKGASIAAWPFPLTCLRLAPRRR
jgi:hypothetical protein